MPMLNIHDIIQRVNKLKQESVEKDEAICDQQMQIEELVAKIEDLESHCRALENNLVDLTELEIGRSNQSHNAHPLPERVTGEHGRARAVFGKAGLGHSLQTPPDLIGIGLRVGSNR